jgi:translocation and assembly module TamA
MSSSGWAVRIGVPIALALVMGADALAARVGIQIEGLPKELAEAARASLELAHYADRDVSDAQVRRLFARSEEQIRAALEPFGYYSAQVKGDLQRTDEQNYQAVFAVQPGEPVIVRKADVRVMGSAAELPAVKQALDAFKPAVGEPMDHGAYESSKARIDTALRADGYLDAKLVQRRVGVMRGAHSADIELAWDSGQRYRLGEATFLESQFSPGFLQRYVPWKPGDYYSADQLLALQQRLVDADYFSSVAVQPLTDQVADGVVPVEVLLIPAKRTVYSAGVFVSTDTGAGVRASMDRRWMNRSGHKLRTDLEYSQRLENYGVTYKIPRPGPDNRSYNFGIAYRDEQTDTSITRNIRLAANDSRDWKGFVRTIGLQYLGGDFEIADEWNSSNLLFAEGVLSRKRADNLSFVARGYSLNFALRAALESVLSDTTFVQVGADAKWIRRVEEDGRVILRGGLGAMTVDDFDALPPELRFFAGGDRTVRGFDYEELGARNADGKVIGGKYLAYLGAEYEHYFLPNWGAAVFTDAGDAFSDRFSTNVSVGIGVRWKSPIGVVRVDIAKPVVTDYDDGLRFHVVVGPDL